MMMECVFSDFYLFTKIKLLGSQLGKHKCYCDWSSCVDLVYYHTAIKNRMSKLDLPVRCFVHSRPFPL